MLVILNKPHMNVAQVQFVPLFAKHAKGLLGFASVELEGQLRIESIAVYRKRDKPGIRLLFPSRKQEGIERSCVYPTSLALTTHLTQKVEEAVKENYPCLIADRS